ncbi:MAG: cation:proton antiporter [Bacteroidales bacterium]|nr:cation:proton antiporter [Bacteroidales bacterium]
MHEQALPLIVAGVIFLSSLISIRLGLSVAIIEITFGAILGNIGFHPQEWMIYLANFGGILLTYLAGTEIDAKLFKSEFKASFFIGFFSFFTPFIIVLLFTYYIFHWELKASLIAGIALSTTSLAVVYSVLVETGLTKTFLGKIIMTSTFITDMGTALALSILFIKPTKYTLIFLIVSTIVIILVYRFSLFLLRNKTMSNKVIEPEIKLIFAILILFIFLAKLGEQHAILPAFILGMLMSKHFKEERKTVIISRKLRTISYAFITPVFFIVGGMKVSLTLIISAFAMFVILFALKILSKFLGIWLFVTKYLKENRMYTSLLMSTGLTFGTISSLFGLQSGFINQTQYSILVGVVIASAVIPTFVAQRWYMPKYEEDKT